MCVRACVFVVDICVYDVCVCVNVCIIMMCVYVCKCVYVCCVYSILFMDTPRAHLCMLRKHVYS